MDPSAAKRTKDDLYLLYQRHVKTVYRVCYLYMKNPQDTEDMVQSTFLKLFQYPGEFSDSEHEKAWLIVTAGNLCKDQLKSWWRKRRVPLEESIQCQEVGPLPDETLEKVLALPPQ